MNPDYFCEVIGGEIRKARKDHRCSLCGRTIFSGFRYWYHRIKPWDHPDNEIFMDFKVHDFCAYNWFDESIGAEFDWKFPGPIGEGREFLASSVHRGSHFEIREPIGKYSDLTPGDGETIG